MPTHDVKGEEIGKGPLKKLQKLYQLQEKKHNDYLASLKKWWVIIFERNSFLNIFPHLSRGDSSFSLVQYKPVINVTGNYYLMEYQFLLFTPENIQNSFFSLFFRLLSALGFD